MRRRLRFLPVLVAAAVLAATLVARFATTNAHADVIAVLQASVGPDFAISLENPAGSVVGHLDAEAYEDPGQRPGGGTTTTTSKAPESAWRPACPTCRPPTGWSRSATASTPTAPAGTKLTPTLDGKRVASSFTVTR